MTYRPLPEHLTISVIEACDVEHKPKQRRRWWRFGR